MQRQIQVCETNFTKKLLDTIHCFRYQRWSGILTDNMPARTTSSKAAPAKQHAEPSAPPPMLLPSHAQIDAAMQRNFGYDPGVHVEHS